MAAPAAPATAPVATATPNPDKRIRVMIIDSIKNPGDSATFKLLRTAQILSDKLCLMRLDAVADIMHVPSFDAAMESISESGLAKNNQWQGAKPDIVISRDNDEGRKITDDLVEKLKEEGLLKVTFVKIGGRDQPSEARFKLGLNGGMNLILEGEERNTKPITELLEKTWSERNPGRQM